MIINASNGKYFLIKTNDNDNKTTQDYMMNEDNRAGLGGPCEPVSIYSRKEVACYRA